MDGWIKLHRKIQGHWLYTEKRVFSKYEAWLDLLLMASYKDSKFVSGNELLQTERGCLVTSELQLMGKWDWSKTKVRSFLKLLEDDNMIIKKADTKKTTITIVNYDIYQEVQTAKEPQEDYGETEQELQKDFRQTRQELQKDTIKEIKKDKNLKNFKKEERECAPTPKLNKNAYGEFNVQLTDTEYNSLVTEYGLDKTLNYIEQLGSYMVTHNEDYCGQHYAAIKRFIRQDEGKSTAKQQVQPNKNRFINFKQRNWNYDQIEQLERQYLNASLEQ